MDDFFSKYGWVVAVGVIIAIVITMMSPVGNLIQAEITQFITDFSNKLATFTSALSIVPPSN